MQEQTVRFQEILEKALEDLKKQLLTQYRQELESEHGKLRQSPSSDSHQLLNSDAHLAPAQEACQRNSGLGARVQNVAQIKVDLSVSTGVATGAEAESASSLSSLRGRPTRSIDLAHEDAVLGRWAQLYDSLVKPTLQRRKFQVASCWAPFVAKLRGEGNEGMLVLSKAMVKIAESRLNQFMGRPAIMSKDRSFYPIHPDSRLSTMCLLASIAIIIYDVTVFPFATFFAEDKVSVPMEASFWAIAIFWSLDIAMSFITGRDTGGKVSMKLRRIRQDYFKSWFCFDLLLLIVSDWVQRVAYLIDRSDDSGRYIRYVALARVLRIFKMNSVLVRGPTTPIGVLLSSGLARMIFLFVVAVHVVACLWYGIGKSTSGGWASGDYGPHDVWHSYWTAVHWSLSQIHGASWLDQSTTVETAFETMWLLCGFACFCIFIAKVIHSTAWIGSNTSASLECARWAKAHGISSQSTRQAQVFLRASNFTRVKNTAAHRVRREADLLQKFPQKLREELLEQARRPLLTSMVFLKELGWTCSQVVRSLCFEALQAVGVVSQEIVFSSNDPSSCVRFIQSGRLIYLPYTGRVNHAITSARLSNFVDWYVTASASMQWEDVNISAGRVVSEAALWTLWHYCCDLTCTKESVIIELSSELFFTVVERRFEACLLAARHAERFVRFLRQHDHVSDLLEFQPPIDHIGQPMTHQLSYPQRTCFSHCIFISHYKIEAGTEATLLQDTSTDLLENRADHEYISSLVFLDSEDLTDLRTLVEHVKQSDNFVLLLTPGLLTRPWCLVEIVIAYRNSVQIVPVQIMRLDMHFQYPSQEFYEQMLRGEILDDSAIALLRQHGIELSELVEAIRHVFEHIAVHFSPQRSKAVRGAEVGSILKRCSLNGTNVSSMKTQTPVAAHMSATPRCLGRNGTWERSASFSSSAELHASSAMSLADLHHASSAMSL